MASDAVAAPLTIQMPMLVMVAGSRTNQAAKNLFGALRNASSYYMLRSGAAGACAAGVLNNSGATTTALSAGDDYPTGAPALLDTLSVSGFTNIQVNSLTQVSEVNVWTGAASIADAGICIVAQDLTTPAGQDFNFYGGMVLQGPVTGLGHALMRNYLAAKIGVSL